MNNKKSVKEPIFVLLMRLAEKDGAAPMNKHEGCWERQIGEWWVAINGHRDPRKCSRGPDVQPFNCYAEFNGWPAGVFDPFGGVIATGIITSEEIFAAAIEAEIAAS